VKISFHNNSYEEMKNKQVFYNSQLLLNKNKHKINNLYASVEDITLTGKKIKNSIHSTTKESILRS